MNRAQAFDLADLMFHWDTAYKIDFDGALWTAARANNLSHVLTADSADELRQKIRLDYSAWTNYRGLSERLST
jgi:hypothetical protein